MNYLLKHFVSCIDCRAIECKAKRKMFQKESVCERICPSQNLDD